MWTNGAALRSMNSTDSILEEKVLKMTHLDLQNVSRHTMCVPMLGGPSLRLGIPTERLSNTPGIG